jgi:hypothetical protein
MTLDQMMEEWRLDATVDSTELGIASLKIPELHSKYLKIYFDERRKLKALEFQSKDLSLKKYEYYNGKLSQEELDELNWEPFVKRLMKNEVDMYLDSDKDIIHNNVRIINQKEKLAFLEEVLKNINQRNFQIKNAIEWKKFTQGVQ